MQTFDTARLQACCNGAAQQLNGDPEMTVYRSERERRDEETGHWQLLDEIIASIRAEYQTADEVIAALLTALAKIIAQADLSDEQVEKLKQRLNSAVEFQRAIEFS
jgi:hypothetical protein